MVSVSVGYAVCDQCMVCVVSATKEMNKGKMGASSAVVENQRGTGAQVGESIYPSIKGTN